MSTFAGLMTGEMITMRAFCLAMTVVLLTSFTVGCGGESQEIEKSANAPTSQQLDEMRENMMKNMGVKQARPKRSAK
jgi:hypothetical protein